MRAAEAPYVAASKVFTGLYFAYFLLVLPALAWLNRQLLDGQEATTSSTLPVKQQRGCVSRPRRVLRLASSGRLQKRHEELQRLESKFFEWEWLV